MRMQGRTRARALKAGVATAVFLLFGLLLAASGCAKSSSTSQKATAHPDVLPEQLCSACKAPGHDYVHVAPYEGDCRTCHRTQSWTWVTYRHANENMNVGFHEIVGCAFCHTKARLEPKPECGECHTPTSHPPLSPCTNCHVPTAWSTPVVVPARHVSLTGGHTELTCFSCHKGAKAFALPTRCVACHGAKHGGLEKCEGCHDPKYGWKPKPGFNHNKYFRLTGRHARLACKRCHPRNTFVLGRPTCVSCHKRKHGGLSDCSRCHTTSAFRPATFRHWRVFTLSGAHARLACAKCHARNAYASVKGGGSTACVSCHGSMHGGLKNCSACHTTSSFDPSTFSHSSRWRLTGRHAALACKKCHPSNRYASVIGSPSKCSNCHGKKHGIKTACDKCHTTKGFSPIKKITHPVPPTLGGEHAKRACSLCHRTLVFTATPRSCNECHNAPHVGPTDCERCHRPTVWTDVHFYTHDEIGYHTGIPFEDACIYCHTTGNYLVQTCGACHIGF